jgi:hypothetical protein
VVGEGLSVSKRLITSKYSYYMLVIVALVLSSGAWLKWD